MKTRHLGRTGLKVSEICLGTMTFGNQCDQPTSFAILDRAWEGGVNFLDTADVYPLGGGLERVGRTEEIVGAWLRERGLRDKVVLATKAAGRMGEGSNDQGLSRYHLMQAVEASLRRLGTDHIDLYQVHSPDPETPIEETLEALTELVRRGMVRYIGCSNFSAWMLAGALWASDLRCLARFDSVQPRYNLIFRMIEDELLPLCRQHGVGVIAYNPLAGGMLSGRYRFDQEVAEGRFTLGHGSGEMYRRRYWNQAVFSAVDRMAGLAREAGLGMVELAVAWVLAQPGLSSAIVGASKPEQLAASLAASDIDLPAEVLTSLDGLWYDLPRERDPRLARR
jgi:aryl-alcohol dehydrogenase-like predicted oxidoreductase